MHVQSDPFYPFFRYPFFDSRYYPVVMLQSLFSFFMYLLLVILVLCIKNQKKCLKNLITSLYPVHKCADKRGPTVTTLNIISGQMRLTSTWFPYKWLRDVAWIDKTIKFYNIIPYCRGYTKLTTNAIVDLHLLQYLVKYSYCLHISFGEVHGVYQWYNTDTLNEESNVHYFY